MVLDLTLYLTLCGSQESQSTRGAYGLDQRRTAVGEAYRLACNWAIHFSAVHLWFEVEKCAELVAQHDVIVLVNILLHQRL